MPRTIEYWWICNDMSRFDHPQSPGGGNLYQCVMNAGLFEAAGRDVSIGLYDSARTVIYQTGSWNSRIYCVHRHPTFNERDTIDNISLACGHFSYLTDRDYNHDDGYWELLDAYHYFQRSRSMINFEFIWRQDLVRRFRTKLKTEEEVDWMKEGF